MGLKERSKRGKTEGEKRERVTPRARRKQAPRGVPAKRTAHIGMLMVTGEWEGTESCEELAKEWGVAVATVKALAVQASRFLDIARDDRGQLEEFCRQRLVDIANEEGHDRVQAVRTLLENKGLLRQKRETTHKYDEAPKDEVVDAALDELLADPKIREQLRGRLQKEEN